MSALRKKIAEKKAAEEAAKAAAAAENPLPVAPPPPPPKPKPDGPIKSGFLAKDGALLYPDGSNEAAPSLWRKGGTEETKLELKAFDDKYVVSGDFKAAGRFLGKEDFKVERLGLVLRIRGTAEDPESLVAGLDTTVNLPPDASHEGLEAEYGGENNQYMLRITIPRVTEGPLAELVAGMSLQQAQAMGAAIERDVKMQKERQNMVELEAAALAAQAQSMANAVDVSDTIEEEPSPAAESAGAVQSSSIDGTEV